MFAAQCPECNGDPMCWACRGTNKAWGTFRRKQESKRDLRLIRGLHMKNSKCGKVKVRQCTIRPA